MIKTVLVALCASVSMRSALAGDEVESALAEAQSVLQGERHERKMFELADCQGVTPDPVTGLLPMDCTGTDAEGNRVCPNMVSYIDKASLDNVPVGETIETTDKRYCVGERTGNWWGELPCWMDHRCTHGTCFHGTSKVLLEDGSSKTMAELKLGDSIQSSDFDGKVSFSPVVFLPHKHNEEESTFLTFKTSGGKTLMVTPDHLFPTCKSRGTVVQARELKTGACLMTVDGEENLNEIVTSTEKGIFTAVTENKFVVVDGVIASPFSQDRKIERQHQTRERQRLLQRERKLLRKGA